MDLIAQAQFGDTSIPASQALSPAGFNQVAFRPACPQVVAVGQANGTTAWTLPMPDGANITLLELPSNLGVDTAWKELDSYGLCKIGGDVVPVIYTRQLPERSMAAPIVEASTGGTQPADLAPTSEPQGGGMIGLVAGSVLLLAMAAGVVAYSRRKPKAVAPSAAPSSAAPSSAAPSGFPPAPPWTKLDKPPQRVATRKADLDDLLGGE
jgi:hypothetical protein